MMVRFVESIHVVSVFIKAMVYCQAYSLLNIIVSGFLFFELLTNFSATPPANSL